MKNVGKLKFDGNELEAKVMNQHKMKKYEVERRSSGGDGGRGNENELPPRVGR